MAGTTEETVAASGLRRALGATAIAAALFVGVAGFAHTRPGRPLLAMVRTLLGLAGARCPLGFDAAPTAAHRERQRQRFSEGHRGAVKAASRPALGFKLDETRRPDILAWARQHGVDCAKPAAGPDLSCRNVPAQLLPARFGAMPIRELWLSFGTGERLTSLVAVRHDAQAGAVSRTFDELNAALAEEAGPVTTRDGDSSPAQLASGPLRQANAEYRFRDYYALARATNLGDGFVLTEEYRSLSD